MFLVNYYGWKIEDHVYWILYMVRGFEIVNMKIVL